MISSLAFLKDALEVIQTHLMVSSDWLLKYL